MWILEMASKAGLESRKMRMLKVQLQDFKLFLSLISSK